MAHQRWIVVGRLRGTGANLEYLGDYRWKWLAEFICDVNALFGAECYVKTMWRP